MKKNFELLAKLIELDESTTNQLISNTKVMFDTPRDSNSTPVQITALQFIPMVQDSKIKVVCKTRSKSSTYSTTMEFKNVRYVDEGTPHSVSFTAPDGSDYHIMPVRKSVEDTKVRCTCLDFYFMFSVWNHKDDSLHGDAPEPYVKKTDSPPRNPERVPGTCKHIIKLEKVLTGQRILK